MRKYLYFTISIILILLVIVSVFIWKEQYKKESQSPAINNIETSNLSDNNDSNNGMETTVFNAENKTDTQTTELKEFIRIILQKKLKSQLLLKKKLRYKLVKRKKQKIQ